MLKLDLDFSFTSSLYNDWDDPNDQHFTPFLPLEVNNEKEKELSMLP